TYCWFRRGMVGDVWCTLRYFVKRAKAILDAVPLETLCLRRTTSSNIRELASHEEFQRVQGVEFLLDETPNAVVLRFVEKTPVEHLQELTLTTRFVNAISPGWHSRNVAIATAIAGCSGLANLKRLRLSHAGVGDEGGLALTQSEHLEGLQILDLTNC